MMPHDGDPLAQSGVLQPFGVKPRGEKKKKEHHRILCFNLFYFSLFSSFFFSHFLGFPFFFLFSLSLYPLTSLSSFPCLLVSYTFLASSNMATMVTTNELPASDVNNYDYIIVGGGTAGCVIASRLAQYLPNKRILVIEGGPSDYMDDRVLNLREWLNLLGGELDYDYPTVEQPMGKFKMLPIRDAYL